MVRGTWPWLKIKIKRTRGCRLDRWLPSNSSYGLLRVPTEKTKQGFQGQPRCSSYKITNFHTVFDIK